MSRTPSPELDRDALDACRAAVERAVALREEWESLERPYLVGRYRGQPRPHPLLRSIAEAELLADRLRERLRVKYRGPSPLAVVSPIGPSPSAKLKAARAKQKPGA